MKKNFKNKIRVQKKFNIFVLWVKILGLQLKIHFVHQIKIMLLNTEIFLEKELILLLLKVNNHSNPPKLLDQITIIKKGI